MSVGKSYWRDSQRVESLRTVLHHLDKAVAILSKLPQRTLFEGSVGELVEAARNMLAEKLNSIEPEEESETIQDPLLAEEIVDVPSEQADRLGI